MAFKDELSKNLKRFRKARNLTQLELALMVGLDVRYISRLESYPQNVRIDMLAKLAHGLGCDVSALLGQPPTGPMSLEHMREIKRCISKLSEIFQL